jgi:deoxyribodipyrimidine photo-lyase
VFVFDESILAGFARPDARIGFLVETLRDLQEQFRAYASDLLVFHGKSEELIPQLLTTYKADACFRNRSY